MKKPLTALMLNAFVLPGMGQIYLGEKNKGILIIVATNILLVAALFLVMKIISPLLGAHLAGNSVTAAQIMTGIEPYAFWAKLLLAAMFALWGYAVVDLAGAFRNKEQDFQQS